MGLALIGVNRGYKVKLFVPEGFAEEKCILMRGFGAEVVRTPEAEGMKGAIREANKLLRRFRVPSWRGSLRIRRIRSFIMTRPPWRSGSRWKGGGWVCGGRGNGRNVFRGCAVSEGDESGGRLRLRWRRRARFCKEARRESIAWKASAFRLFRRRFIATVCDRVVMVSDDDAFAMVKRLAAEEGAGWRSSAGAAVHAALEMARELGPGKRVATMIPDSAERYLSKKIFEGGI